MIVLKIVKEFTMFAALLLLLLGFGFIGMNEVAGESVWGTGMLCIFLAGGMGFIHEVTKSVLRQLN